VEFGLLKTVPKSYTVQPIAKAMRLLEAIAWKKHDVTLTEIAREIGLPKTTAFRYLQTLASAGFIRHDVKNDRYGIGPRVRMFAESENSMSHLRRSAAPHMVNLAEIYCATINLAISSGLDIVYVEMARGNRTLPMRARIGEHHPLHTTAVGKAILAFLPPGEQASILDAPLVEMTARTICSTAVLRRQLSEIYRNGYSLDREETEAGISCIGVPILDQDGYPFAALSLSATDNRIMSILDKATQALKAAVAEIRIAA
jgi:IclR family acetate operon transcriptional repressor